MTVNLLLNKPAATMRPLLRRAMLVLLFLAAVPAAYASRALAVDALPDARFVGYAQTHNDFEIASARLALSKSGNENVRGYANRMLVEHDLAAQHLAKSRSEAGVSYAPDPNEPTVAVLRRLSSLEGPEFDAAYANTQLAAMTNAEAQYQLGLMMADGTGGARDEAGARSLFEKAAAQNHPAALEKMGEFTQEGRGGPKDSTAAKAYYERAAALGDEEARKALKRIECPYVIKDKRGNVVTNLCF